MRRFVSVSLSVALGLAAVAAVPALAQRSNSRNSIGDSETPGYLHFNNANEVHTFQVTIPDGSDGDSRYGRLTVDTQDCCQYAGNWGVRLIKHNGQVMAQAVGDGSGQGNFSVVPDPDDSSGAATTPRFHRRA